MFRVAIDLPAGLTPGTATVAAQAATATSLSFGPGLVYLHSAPVQFCTVQSFDCLIRRGRIAHFHKGEATRATGVSVRHQVHPIHGAITFEHCTNARFRRAEIQIANKDVLQNHSPSFLIEQLNQAGFEAAELLRDDQKLA
jgi:hypothetical protein